MFGEWDDLILQDGDLAEDVFCQTIRVMISGAIDTENEVIESIRLENKELQIVVSWNKQATEVLTDGMLAQTRTSSITDSILEYEELDSYWNQITIEFPLNNRVTLGKDLIVASEYGRYFSSVDIMKQIPD